MSKDYTTDQSQYTHYFESVAATVINEDASLSEFQNNHINDLEIQDPDNDVHARAVNFASNNYSLPKAIDTCKFCNKTFLYPGSLGRHLDRKKGTPDHPAGEIAEIRSNVRRVGDIQMSKLRARERQRRYRSKENVKEKLREQRKRRYYLKKTTDKNSTSPFDFTISYPLFIVRNLEPLKWPELLPTKETLDLLSSKMTSEDEISKLQAIHEEWTKLPEIEKYRQYLCLTQELLKKR